ncbi:replication protein [Aerococcaceae bacterium NML191292]|nr:replication protein [Aerococcaceae bacterium NML210727]MCW6655364.1 replication protein [Aerococcaceae bacterium NML201296]MCW6660502.1 replication protein [Aerococcaceae bacterium NML191292]MCW6662254.1 replication protein [Aerococcaceae bacterium NML201209]
MSKLTPKQEKFLLALLDTPTLKQASQQANISENTGRKWLQDDLFSEEYKRMRRELMKQTTARMQYLALRATEELEKILDDSEASVFAKIQASQMIINKAYKGMELEDFADRLERLERKHNL